MQVDFKNNVFSLLNSYTAELKNQLIFSSYWHKKLLGLKNKFDWIKNLSL